jgi:hypothetical protein
LVAAEGRAKQSGGKFNRMILIDFGRGYQRTAA